MMSQRNLSYPTILDVIGNTPLVKLQGLVKNPLVTILLKLEFLNPAGSIKDRIVFHIIDQAEKAGLLRPGGTIIESTSGNTGAAAAMIGAIRGYHVILTMPDKVSIEKQNVLKAYGAEVIITPTSASPDSPEHYVNKAKKIAQEMPNSFRIDQYDNARNPEAHYLYTGPEIWEQTDGNVDYLVASASTGGSITGIGRFLKEKNSGIRVVMPDPIGSIYYQYAKTKNPSLRGSCSYFLEGIGEDHLPRAVDFSYIDEVVQVPDRDAFQMARKLAQQEGILAGGSTGANVWASIEISKQATKPITIVTLAPDLGVKYLSKCFDDNWMKQHDFLEA